MQSDSSLDQEFQPCSQIFVGAMCPSTGMIRALAWCQEWQNPVLTGEGLSSYKPNSQQICLDVKYKLVQFHL